MVRLVIWIILLGAMVYAAKLVRDGQTTLLGTPSPWFHALLDKLPLPANKPTAEVNSPPPVTVPPQLLRRLTLVESVQGEQNTTLRTLREKDITAINQAVDSLQQQLSRLASHSLAMEKGEVKVRWDDNGWRLEDFFAKRRVWNQRINFGRAYSQPPQVVLGMTRIETGPEGSVDIGPANVDNTGFILALQAEEGRPREVKVQWLAFGSAAPLQ